MAPQTIYPTPYVLQINGYPHEVVGEHPEQNTGVPVFDIRVPAGLPNGGTPGILRPWCSRPDLYYPEYNGCSSHANRGTVQRVNGALVDVTADFAAAAVTYSGRVGSLCPTYTMPDGRVLAGVGFKPAEPTA